MGAIAGLLGIGGGGSDFKAATANILDPRVALAESNAQALRGVNQVGQTAQTLAPAAGLGLGRQNDQYAQMQQLANQLQAQSQGAGPNPALAQLAQTTGQNAAQTAALMASARGASANPGMIARQAAQQGAMIQQDAAGQAATLRAQQQLAAQQQLQQQQAQQAALGTTQVQEGLTGAQAGAQAAGGYAQMLQDQLNQFNQLNLANTQQANTSNANVQSKAGGDFLGDVLTGGAKAIGTAVSGIKFAEGGEVPSPLQPAEASVGQSGPRSTVGKFLAGLASASTESLTSPEKMKALGAVSQELSRMKSSMQSPKDGRSDSFVNRVPYAQGGQVKAMVSPGEKYLPPAAAKAVASGKKSPTSAGETIKGKARVPGDSYANDVVEKKLQPGGVVIPRSVMQSKDPASNAAKFVAAVLAKQKRR